MANITRKFTVYAISCKKLIVQDDGTPVFEDIWEGQEFDVTMNAERARKVVREATGIQKLDASYYITFKPVQVHTFAIDRDKFLEVAEVISVQNCEE